MQRPMSQKTVATILKQIGKKPKEFLLKTHGAKLISLSDKIHIFHFSEQYELAMSFVRMQEFYESESEDFKGKYFTLENFVDFYSKKHGNGSFTYPSDWHGFNIPGNVWVEWGRVFSGKNDAPRSKELALRLPFSQINPEDVRKMYFIGITGKLPLNNSSYGALIHEIAHALYSTSDVYKKEIDTLSRSIPEKTITAIKNKLGDMGYSDAVFWDEIQAYSISGSENLGVDGFLNETSFECFQNIFSKNMKKEGITIPKSMNCMNLPGL